MSNEHRAVKLQLFVMGIESGSRKIINHDFVQGQGNPSWYHRFATSTTRQDSCKSLTLGGFRRDGAEVAGWTLDRKIRVQFPAYPHRVWAIWWQGGKRRLRTSWCPCRGRFGTLKTPSCPWRGCPAAGQNLETGHLSRHYIAEISLNVTLNHNQQQQQLCPFTQSWKILIMNATGNT